MSAVTYMAKNKATGKVSGPFTQEYKDNIENNRSTWKRHIWTEVTPPKPAAIPASLAVAVKPAKQEKAPGTSAGDE
jgi:hypothetical protein